MSAAYWPCVWLGPYLVAGVGVETTGAQRSKEHA